MLSIALSGVCPATSTMWWSDRRTAHCINVMYQVRWTPTSPYVLFVVRPAAEAIHNCPRFYNHAKLIPGQRIIIATMINASMDSWSEAVRHVEYLACHNMLSRNHCYLVTQQKRTWPYSTPPPTTGAWYLIYRPGGMNGWVCESFASKLLTQETNSVIVNNMSCKSNPYFGISNQAYSTCRFHLSPGGVTSELPEDLAADFQTPYLLQLLRRSDPKG
jgi:hypothetical protein